MVFAKHDLTKNNNQKIEKQILIKNLFVSYGPILIKKIAFLFIKKKYVNIALENIFVDFSLHCFWNLQSVCKIP